jgi:aryl-alcohol dehydrogenase-like predicted oxidoreductase
MKRVKLGRTGLEVGVAGLGCGGHSRLGMATGHDEAHATRVVECALDLGIDFIDTARAYGTEVAVGKALRGRRDHVVISTKSIASRGDRALSAGELRESLEKSLRRLDTDYVDIFHLHGIVEAEYEHCAEVLIPELERLREEGKIRFIGATERFVADPGHRMLRRALPDDPFDVIMVGFNLLNPSARETVFPLTRKHDVGTLIMFAVRRALSRRDALVDLVRGLVERGEVDPSGLELADPLGFVAAHAEVRSLVDAAYRFCRHEPGAHVILTGTGNPDHLRENVASILRPPLPDELAARLREIFGRIDSVSAN